MVGTRVYVGGLPYGTRERDLERFFRGYGRFRDVLIKNGYGFVVSICIPAVNTDSNTLHYLIWSHKNVYQFLSFDLKTLDS